jgi:DNA anti-recombination protein RmuC
MHQVDTKPERPAPITKPAPGSEPKSGSTDDLAGGNIDKVRDILFGGQMRDYERRFARLEERLVQETAELKDDVRRRLAALEQFIKQEADSLADRIKTEHDERTDATKDLAREAHDNAKAFEKKAGLIDDQIGKTQRELRQQILELHQRVSDELRQKVDEVIARLNQESAELRNDKTDRATLAALLTEMAMRLTNELSIPGIDKGRNG